MTTTATKPKWLSKRLALMKLGVRCPVCRSSLLAIADMTNSEQVDREYFHDSMNGKLRRSCLRTFYDLKLAAEERSSLEVQFGSTD